MNESEGGPHACTIPSSTSRIRVVFPDSWMGLMLVDVSSGGLHEIIKTYLICIHNCNELIWTHGCLFHIFSHWLIEGSPIEAKYPSFYHHFATILPYPGWLFRHRTKPSATAATGTRMCCNRPGGSRGFFHISLGWFRHIQMGIPTRREMYIYIWLCIFLIN